MSARGLGNLLAAMNTRPFGPKLLNQRSWLYLFVFYNTNTFLKLSYWWNLSTCSLTIIYKIDSFFLGFLPWYFPMNIKGTVNSHILSLRWVMRIKNNPKILLTNHIWYHRYKKIIQITVSWNSALLSGRDNPTCSDVSYHENHVTVSVIIFRSMVSIPIESGHRCPGLAIFLSTSTPGRNLL